MRMFKHSIWIYIELFLIIQWVKATSTPLSYDSFHDENLVMRQKWEECCIKNICIYNSCFFALRRSSNWAAIRQRCQNRFLDYPLSIDLAQIRNEDDLELLSRMMFEENNTKSPEASKVWTGGISCPASKSKGPSIYLTKWTNSDSPLPEWLQEKISYTHDKSLDKGGCKFLAFTPANNISDIQFEFQDQRARHLGVCEFILPEELLTSKGTLSELTSTSATEETSTLTQTTKSYITTTLTSTNIKSKTLGPPDTFSTTSIKEETERTSKTTSTSITITPTSSSTIADPNTMKFCEGKREAEIDWPNTAPGAIANESCPQGMNGFAQWFCDPTTLQFTPKIPDIQGCTHVWIKELDDNVENGEDAVDISAELAKATKKENMSHGDITALVALSTKIMHLFSMQIQEEDIEEDKDKPKSYMFTGSMVLSMSNMLRADIKDAWSFLPVSHQTRAASKILQIVTIIGSHLSCIKKSEDKLQFSVEAENIDLQTFIMNKEKQDENDKIVFPQKVKGVKFNSSLIVPANLNWRGPRLSCKDYNTAVGVLYSNVGEFLKEENESSSSKKVVTKVISFSMNNYTQSFVLPEGKLVTIVLQHNSTQYQHLRCMFWNFSKSSYGEWDDSGCSRIDSNETHVICSCNHLTNFAVLMDVNNNVEEDDILSLLTYVCCGMSSLSLVITLICFLSVRALHGKRSIITGNLCLSLLITNLLILFGLDKTGNKILCAIIAAFLHFWILSAFCWMLVEGYHLYKMVVLVFERGNQLSIKAYYLIAYGLPLAIVSISLGIKTDLYGGDTYCWLSSEDGLMWSFVGPACAVILVNIVVFILTLRSASSVRIKREQTALKRIKNWARGSMSVMCLLGLTWCLGLFYIDRKLQIFSYIFTVFNGLQGVFIFLFHVLLNEKIHSILNWNGKNRSCFKKGSQQTSSNQLHSRLSTKTSVNSLGCVSCNVSVVNTRRSSNATSHHKSSKENINANRTKIMGKKNWSSENCRSNINKERATHTVSENGISNFHPQRRYKTRSQSFPEEGDNARVCNNIEYITNNNNRMTVEKSFR